VVARPAVSARDAVLASIRSALGPAPAVPEVPRGYRAAGAAGTGAAATVERLAARVADYRATIARTDAASLEAVLADACAARGTKRLAVAPGVAWRVPGVELVRDDAPLDVAELDAVDGVLTGCALAIAETGTIVLDGGAESGRRALTLVPDHHVCVVREAQVVAGVPDAIAALAPAAAEGRPLTLVSGPSATSDIELERVEGVHGPRMLDIVVVSEL
jgi:L-lactate dehydrogenase complex protein LldG